MRLCITKYFASDLPVTMLVNENKFAIYTVIKKLANIKCREIKSTSIKQTPPRETRIYLNKLHSTNYFYTGLNNKSSGLNTGLNIPIFSYKLKIVELNQNKIDRVDLAPGWKSTNINQVMRTNSFKKNNSSFISILQVQ